MRENTDQKNYECGHFLRSGNGNSFLVGSTFMAKAAQSIITRRNNYNSVWKSAVP